MALRNGTPTSKRGTVELAHTPEASSHAIATTTKWLRKPYGGHRQALTDADFGLPPSSVVAAAAVRSLSSPAMEEVLAPPCRSQFARAGSTYPPPSPPPLPPPLPPVSPSPDTADRGGRMDSIYSQRIGRGKGGLVGVSCCCCCCRGGIYYTRTRVVRSSQNSPPGATWNRAALD